MKKVINLLVLLLAIFTVIPFSSAHAVEQGMVKDAKGNLTLNLNVDTDYTYADLYSDLSDVGIQLNKYSSYSLNSDGSNSFRYNSSAVVSFTSGEKYALYRKDSNSWTNIMDFTIALYIYPQLTLPDGSSVNLNESVIGAELNLSTNAIVYKPDKKLVFETDNGAISYTAEYNSEKQSYEAQIIVPSDGKIIAHYEDIPSEITDIIIIGKGTVFGVEENINYHGKQCITAVPYASDDPTEGYFVQSIRLDGKDVEEISFDNTVAVTTLELVAGQKHTVEVTFGKIKLAVKNPAGEAAFNPVKASETQSEELKASLYSAIVDTENSENINSERAVFEVWDSKKGYIPLNNADLSFFESGKKIRLTVVGDGRYPTVSVEDVTVNFTDSREHTAISSVDSVQIIYGTSEKDVLSRLKASVVTDNNEKIDGVKIKENVSDLSAGEYVITLAFQGTERFLPCEKAVKLTVDKAAVTITVDNKSKFVYQPDPEFTYSITGLAEGEGIENIVIRRQKGNTAGDYIISAEYKQNKNYAITVINGKLTVTHDPEKYTVDKRVEADCQKNGFTEGSHCSGCGEIFTAQKKIPTLGHSFSSSYTVDKKATYKTEGSQSKHCTRKGCTAKTDVTATPMLTPGKVTGIKVTPYTTSLKVSWKKVTGAEEYEVYYSTNGKSWKKAKASKNSLTLKKLKSSTDYKIKVRAVTGKRKGSYSAVLSSATKPVRVALASLKSSKAKTLTVAWKKVSGANGYEIQYSTSKKFKSAKTVTVKKNKTVKATLKKLKSSKRYYVKVRAYKTVKGKKICGSWNIAKSIKIK